jgi:arsenite methyltransferase
MSMEQIRAGASVRSIWHHATGLVATALALIACYGTLALVSVLSFAGISIEIENGLWAGAIVTFFGLAVGLLAFRGNRQSGPTLLGLIGFGLMVWTMFGSYNWIAELLAFAMLIVATLWNRSVRQLQTR